MLLAEITVMSVTKTQCSINQGSNNELYFLRYRGGQGALP